MTPLSHRASVAVCVLWQNREESAELPRRLRLASFSRWWLGGLLILASKLAVLDPLGLLHSAIELVLLSHARNALGSLRPARGIDPSTRLQTLLSDLIDTPEEGGIHTILDPAEDDVIGGYHPFATRLMASTM